MSAGDRRRVDTGELSVAWRVVVEELGLPLPVELLPEYFEMIPRSKLLEIVDGEWWLPREYAEYRRASLTALVGPPALPPELWDAVDQAITAYNAREDIACEFWYRMGVGVGAYIEHAQNARPQPHDNARGDTELALRIIAHQARRTN